MRGSQSVLARRLAPGDQPPRYRASRRRSIRTALIAAGFLVSATSALSALQFVVRPSSDSPALLALNLLQVSLGLAVVGAMRSRLRRYPIAIAFGFLLVTPIVPLATLQVQPGTIVLIAASLALIPIAVALFIPWRHQTYAVWSAGYLAIIVTGNVLWASSADDESGTWYLLMAVVIGTVFGVLGQRRRDLADRLAFARAQTLRALVEQSAAQQVALKRLNAELDRVLGQEIRGRESIEATLAQIDPGAPAAEIATTACRELIKLPGIDSAWVIAFNPGHARLLADAGITVGRAAVPGLAGLPIADLPDKAAHGPWVQPADGQLVGSVWSPLRGSRGIIGVVGAGTHDLTMSDRVTELLPAITTYGSLVGTLIAPNLEALHAQSEARARIRRVLDTAAFRPFFQPIVEFHSGDVVGYEALTRFSDGTSPDIVFEQAARAGLGLELELATLAAALDAAAALGADAYLGINASPELLYSTDLVEVLNRVKRQIVVEITEHVAIDDYDRLRTAIASLGPHVRLAVDDAGAGYASLRHILERAPHLVKLDIGLVRGIDADPARQALVAGVGYFAIKRKMRLIAEGIETEAELATLRSLGIDYGQGYLLGRPQDGRGQDPWPASIVSEGLGAPIRSSLTAPTLAET